VYKLKGSAFYKQKIKFNALNGIKICLSLREIIEALRLAYLLY